MTATSTSSERRQRRDRRAASHPLAGELAGALDRDEVTLLFQPQFGADGALYGAEALVRWEHGELGPLAGDELVLIAQGSHGLSELARGLTDHVLRRALALAAAWPEPLRLSLNVTAADLAADDFTRLVTAALAAGVFDPARLTLEITEQAMVAELDRSAARLEELVALGVRVALDDFGAGFCNFRYLKKLPLHYLKLDRSMVQGIAEDRRDLEVLRGIMAMANALDLKVIAEGIENEAQRDAVVREGCAAWQGYLGGKPMPAGDFAAL